MFVRCSTANLISETVHCTVTVQCCAKSVQFCTEASDVLLTCLPEKMAGGSQPEKRLKLDDANNCEQEEIRRLKEVVRGLEESLASVKSVSASRNQKLLEMEESKINVEREKATVEKEKDQLKREKAEIAEEKDKVEEKKIKVEDEKIKFEAKMRKLVECPVCLTLPREGPVPCCANGHLVCNPCLGKLRAENKLEQG